MEFKIKNSPSIAELIVELADARDGKFDNVIKKSNINAIIDELDRLDGKADGNINHWLTYHHIIDGRDGMRARIAREEADGTITHEIAQWQFETIQIYAHELNGTGNTPEGQTTYTTEQYIRDHAKTFTLVD